MDAHPQVIQKPTGLRIALVALTGGVLLTIVWLAVTQSGPGIVAVCILLAMFAVVGVTEATSPEHTPKRSTK